MSDLRVEGAEKFGRVAAALKHSGDKELKREFYRGINRAVKPLTGNVKDSTRFFLPARYAVELSRTLKVRVRRRAGRDPGITLVAASKTKGGKKRDLASLNRGRLRHPLYGNRGFWFNQDVKAGFWDEPLAEDPDTVRRELVQVLDEVAAKLAKKY